MNAVSLRVPVTFPPNPAIGDEFTASNGATYAWDGTVWMAVGGGGGGGAAPLNFRRGLTQIGNDVDLDPATEAIIGGIMEAPSDNHLYSRGNADWVEANPLNFRATTVMGVAGTEVTGAVVATLTIPPADLPNQPFTWIALGQGDGSYFFHNVAPPAAGTVSNTNFNVEVNDAGAWDITAVISLSAAAFPSVGLPVLVRGSSTPGQSNVRRYDPVVDTQGIAIRVVIGAQGPTTAYTLTFGVEGRIIQYGLRKAMAQKPGQQPDA